MKKNREVILNTARRYYHNNIKVLREKSKNEYRDLSEELKNKKKENMEEKDIIETLKKLGKRAKNDARTSL